MTPQERQLVNDLFDRLASVEPNKRDAEAERLIAEGVQRAPHAVYALVQTVLVQDEAMRAADARIRELEGGTPEAGSFLDNMRDTFLGRRDSGRGSVPSIRPDATGGQPAWRGADQPAPGGYQQQGGSFLGTAAATAAGVIGGAMLLNTFRSMFGGHGQQAGMLDSGGERSPWGSDAAGSDLARDAGLNDIGGGGTASGRESSERAGLFDSAAADLNDEGDSDDFDSDFEFGDGDSDTV